MELSRRSRPLPRSGVRLPALGMGTAPIADLYGPVPEAQATEVVRRGLELGVHYFDTAPLYGAGLGEQRLGAALADTSRDRFLISTKVGWLLRDPGEEPDPSDEPTPTGLVPRVDMSASGIRQSLEESLQRLRVDHVDVALLHDPDDCEEQARATALPALLELRREGVVQAVGVGMNDADMLDRFVRDFEIDVVLLAGRYSLLDQAGLRSLLPRCLDRGVGVIVGGVFNSGILADPREGAPFDYRPAAPELVDTARAMAAVCRRHGVPLTAAALQFPLGHPAVVTVLQGPVNRRELEANAGDFLVDVPEECWLDLRREGLLPPDVPVPVTDGEVVHDEGTR